MNNEEFLNEVLSSSICPSGFREMYIDFLRFQKAATDTLREFHQVCEKNGIQYQLAYGSLLGAIRDDGQIPWDYDVDVFVPFEEREKLIEALKQDLDERYYFYCPEIDKRCRHVIMRLAPIEYRTEAIHVDVFYLVGAPDDMKERKRFTRRVKHLAKSRVGKLINTNEESLGSFKRYLYLILRYKLPTILLSVDSIQRKYDYLCSQYPALVANICIQADGDWHSPEFESKYLWDTIIYKTSIGDYRIPRHYKELLELEYGDFSRVPPLEKRVKEVERHYKRLKAFPLNNR